MCDNTPSRRERGHFPDPAANDSGDDNDHNEDHHDGAADHDYDAGASAGHRSCAAQPTDYNDHQRIRQW